MPPNAPETNCPACLRPWIAGASFCPHCGRPAMLHSPPNPHAPNPAAHSPAAHSPAAHRPTEPGAFVDPFRAAQAPGRNVRTGVLVGTGLLLAAVLALLGLHATGVLALGGKQPDRTTLGLQAEQPPAMLARPAEQPPPVLERTAEREIPAVMPPEVRAWLEHLRETESRRQQMVHAQMGQLLTIMAQQSVGGSMVQDLLAELHGVDTGVASPPAQSLADDARTLRARWADLDQFFNSMRPPEECAPIRNQYYTALNETGAMITDVLEQLQLAGQDPQAAIAALSGMRNKSSTIDRAGRETDRLIAEICRKYNESKWFSVEADPAGGMGSLGKFGF
jgi:hypothetical protein